MVATQQLRPLLDALPQALRLPAATYRVQFHAGFGFSEARRLVPYLDTLGVTDLYASPYLKARPGSAHGYDVADPNSLNPEIGTQEDYDELVAELQRHGMGQVLDVVPNHMGIGDSNNRWWLDVLENGPSSIYARFFDIDWHPLTPDSQDRDKVILPVLGDQYGRVLENGELRLSYEDGAFRLHYYDLELPLAPETYRRLLEFRLQDLEAALGDDHDQVLELQSIITALTHLPPRTVQDSKRIKERNREKEIIKRRIARLYEECSPLRATLETTLETYNGAKGDPASFDLLDAILGDQAYRLAFWRVASEEINYRRFFDISQLAAVRMEDPRVFEQTHRLLLELVRTRKISGLRIDHPDGLWDPAGYLWRLQRNCFAKLHARQVIQLRNGDVEPDPQSAERELLQAYDSMRAEDSSSPLLRPVYVTVEKILSSGERLSPDWPVHGTIGYDFLNALNGIFVERTNRRTFDAIYSRFIRSDRRFGDLANSTKKMVMLISLGSEINQLAYQLKRIAARSRSYRDFTLNGLTFAIREIIACMPIYRTYIDPETGSAGERDTAYVEAAVADARRRNPRTDPSLFNFVRDTLLLRHADQATEADRGEQLRFVARFQQTTGPVMAKGVEDTAFYIYNRLVSLNEVGGDPDQFGISLATFHRQNLHRARHCPYSMTATSTHDAKRSEDVRARINVLSEIPREWRSALTRWSRLNGRKKTNVDGRAAPDRNEEYLLYQTLLGSWPFEPFDGERYLIFTNRVVSFMMKALKEAKVNTSWINPNAGYEAAVEHFVRRLLDPAESSAFLSDFHVLREKVAHFGAFNSLSQTLLKIASPGVPDLYQGNECWDFSLVDPDNRRPVDYEARARMLEATQSRVADHGSDLRGLASEFLESKEDGRIKLYTTYRALSARKAQPGLFTSGSYLPLAASGRKKRHLCAFARLHQGTVVVAAAPVLVAGLMRGALLPPLGEMAWESSWMTLPGEPGQKYHNLLTGEVLESLAFNGKPGLWLKDVFETLPVALFERV